MATETVLIPKDKYERLLEMSEKYIDMKNRDSNGDSSNTMKQTDIAELNTEKSVDSAEDISELQEENIKAPESVEEALPGLHIAGERAEKSKKTELERSSKEESQPPGIPLNVIKRRLHKIKRNEMK